MFGTTRAVGFGFIRNEIRTVQNNKNEIYGQ